jgi:hypothetical protein
LQHNQRPYEHDTRFDSAHLHHLRRRLRAPFFFLPPRRDRAALAPSVDVGTPEALTGSRGMALRRGTNRDTMPRVDVAAIAGRQA